MKSFFINEAIDKAINDYLQSKNQKESILFNSFLVAVIRALISIYGELDIINPYQIKNENLFITNLLKYGATKEDIDSLLRLIDGFYIIDKRNQETIRREENVYFIEVQKKLIDLFILKKNNYDVSKKDIDNFYDLLYTPNTKNPLRLSYNYLNAYDIYEVDKYYHKLLNKNINKSVIIEQAKTNYDINVDNMNNKEDNTKLITNELLTTGNGYVDILIIMSIIITVIMVIIIFATLVF